MPGLLQLVDGSFTDHPIPHKVWTRSDLAVLEQSGLVDGQRYELIEGELIEKMGKKRPHVGAVILLVDALREAFGKQFINWEAPIEVHPDDSSRSEPEPDVLVLRRPWQELQDAPKPEDLVLVVEASDTTAALDRSTKARLYARAGIPEYWVLDLSRKSLLVFRDPQGDAYRSRVELHAGDSVNPLERPDYAIAVSSLLP